MSDVVKTPTSRLTAEIRDAYAYETGTMNNPQITCEHHWISIHQPDLPVSWIFQCAICDRIRPDTFAELQAQLAEAKAVVDAIEKARDQLEDQEGDAQNWVNPDGRITSIRVRYMNVIDDVLAEYRKKATS